MKKFTKISVASINNVRRAFPGIGAEPVKVARILGTVRGSVPKMLDGGLYVHKFVGDFLAWNRNHVEHVAPTLYLPAEGESTLLAALADAEGAGVEFIADVFVSQEIGQPQQRYAVRFLKCGKANALAALKAEAAALDAPKPEAAPKAPAKARK